MNTLLLCAYCGEPATTRDHVPPKCFLERPFPPNLKTVPACAACNQGSSLDEEYVLAVLAHIGTSSKLQMKVEAGGVVDRALTYSPRLAETFDRSLVPEDGRVMLEVDNPRIERVIRKITCGLMHLRYGRVPRGSEIAGIFFTPYNIEEGRPVGSFIATYTERFRPKRWRTLQHGVFSYIVVRGVRSRFICILDFHQTLWAEVHLHRLPIVRSVSRTMRNCKMDGFQMALPFMWGENPQ